MKRLMLIPSIFLALAACEVEDTDDVDGTTSSSTSGDESSSSSGDESSSGSDEPSGSDTDASPVDLDPADGFHWPRRPTHPNPCDPPFPPTFHG